MTFVAQIAATLARGVIGWLIVAAILTSFEILNPREKVTLRQRVSGMAYWAVSIPVSAMLVTGLSAVMAAWNIRPLVTLPVFASVAWAGPLAALIAVLIGAIVHDFFFYWFHRIQHRFFWRYHAVHHSIREMSAVNSYHHISETVIGLVFLTIPTTLIVADIGPSLPFVGLALWLHIVWIHSPTRFNFGPLGRWFADNRFHRIHHSLEERHFDHNFGAFTTIWDRVFGTVHFPEADEWPDVGLAEVDQPRDLGQWLDLPERYRAAVVGEVATEQPARPVAA